jgi:hypothetical protein
LWQLPNLKKLYLFENRFSGVIPTGPAPPLLERVYLGHNNLEGPLPEALTMATKIDGPNNLRKFLARGISLA